MASPPPIIRLHTGDRLGIVVTQKTIEDWSGRTLALAVFAHGDHVTPLFETSALAYAHPADDAAAGIVAHLEATDADMDLIPRGAETGYTEYAWRLTVTPGGGEASTISWGVLRVGEWPTGSGCNSIAVSSCQAVVQIATCGPVVLNCVWGLVTGNLADQADLQAALDGKEVLGAAASAVAGHEAANDHIPEAPIDGNQYARLSGAWSVVAAGKWSDDPTYGGIKRVAGVGATQVAAFYKDDGVTRAVKIDQNGIVVEPDNPAALTIDNRYLLLPNANFHIDANGAVLSVGGNTNSSFDVSRTSGLTFGASVNAPSPIIGFQGLFDDRAKHLAVNGCNAWPSATTYISGGRIDITTGAGASGSSGAADSGRLGLFTGAAYGTTGQNGSIVVQCNDHAPRATEMEPNTCVVWRDTVNLNIVLTHKDDLGVITNTVIGAY